jgi:hypothetical protein
MKKIFAFALISSALFTSCEKAFEQPEDWSSVAVIHASPVATTIPTDTLNVFIGDLKYNSAGIVYTGNSTYLPVRSGSQQVVIRRGQRVNNADYINGFSYNFERGKAYSFFAYDTTTSNTGVAKVLRLKDDLTLPTAPNTHVRFLHLAPNAPAVDVTLVRTNVTPNDSVTISNRSYVGATPNEDALSAFSPIPGGTYTAKVKLAGTQTVVLTAALPAAISLASGRIVTLFATGTAKGRALAVGGFRHY